MEKYIDHSGTGAAPTIYQRGKPPGGTITKTDSAWIKKVPPARVSLIEDANTLSQVRNATRAYGIETHALEVKKTRPNADGTCDVQVAVTSESGDSKGLGSPTIITIAIVSVILGGGGWLAWKAGDSLAELPRQIGDKAIGPLGYALAVGGGLYLGGKVGSPWLGALAGVVGVYMYGQSKQKE